MLKETPLISIITLNWNTTPLTCDFLRSINEKNSYPHIEVIVVDNASTDDPSLSFESILPEVRVIRNDSNLGFAGGNNSVSA